MAGNTQQLSPILTNKQPLSQGLKLIETQFLIQSPPRLRSQEEFFSRMPWRQVWGSILAAIVTPSIRLFWTITSGVTEEEGPLGIFGVGAPGDCCHCLTEILYTYKHDPIKSLGSGFRRPKAG
jgi:hypothetical protein